MNTEEISQILDQIYGLADIEMYTVDDHSFSHEEAFNYKQAYQIIKKLVEYGAKPSIDTMKYAISFDDGEMVDKLLSSGIKPTCDIFDLIYKSKASNALQKMFDHNIQLITTNNDGDCIIEQLFFFRDYNTFGDEGLLKCLKIIIEQYKLSPTAPLHDGNETITLLELTEPVRLPKNILEYIKSKC